MKLHFALIAIMSLAVPSAMAPEAATDKPRTSSQCQTDLYLSAIEAANTIADPDAKTAILAQIESLDKALRRLMASGRATEQARIEAGIAFWSESREIRLIVKHLGNVPKSQEVSRLLTAIAGFEFAAAIMADDGAQKAPKPGPPPGPRSNQNPGEDGSTAPPTSSPPPATGRNPREGGSSGTQPGGVRRQCLAITNRGTRCSRMTTSASGFCWQHD